MSLDTGQLTTLITALGGVAATLLVATSRRREARTDQFDRVVRERNAVRRAYDSLLAYAYALRARALDRGDTDVPPIPEEARYDESG